MGLSVAGVSRTQFLHRMVLSQEHHQTFNCLVVGQLMISMVLIGTHVPCWTMVLSVAGELILTGSGAMEHVAPVLAVAQERMVTSPPMP